MPRWLTEQAHVAATPVDAERERLLREDDKEKDKRCNRRVRTLAIIVLIGFVIALLIVLIVLVVQALTTVTSARDHVGAKVALLWNVTEEAALSTKASINSLRGVSQRAELFSATSFNDLSNATRKIHDIAAFMDQSIHRPVSLSLVGR